MSWPSMTIACQPKARQRRANWSRSCCHIVGRLWPSALTSVMPQRLSRPSIGRHVGGFPDRSLGRFAVAEQAVGAVVGLDAARVQRDADRGADALAERSGRDVDERQARRRMPFEIGVDPPQLQQLGAVERAGLGPGGVEQRRRVPLRQHEAIAPRMLRILRIEPHLGEEQRRDEVGGRAAARRMSAAGFRRRPDRVDAKPRGDVLQRGNQRWQRSSA